MNWRVGNRVRLKIGSRERTYTVVKVIIIRHSIVFLRHGVNRYLIKDDKTTQMHEVRAETLTHA